MSQGFSREHISSRGILKVDIRKAFDSVNWDFLFRLLRAASFPPLFISWIEQCVSTAFYSVVVNGDSCGFFRGAKGLRQGDPISPYLFLIVMEFLASSLAKGFEAGTVGYHPKAARLSISHLSFADDLLVLFDGKPSSLQGILGILSEFQILSGLGVNRNKSSLFYAGLNDEEKVEVMSYGFSLGSFPLRYLGLPLVQRKLQVRDFSPLLDSLTRRFASWENKALSYSGRIQLVVSVIYSTLNFWMQAFILPKRCLKRIEQMSSRFIWNNDIRKISGIKVAWRLICLSRDEGGLGLRDLQKWNQVLCLKLIWNLLVSSGSLWVAWSKASYCNGLNFWEIKERSTDGWVWRQLLKLRHVARPFIDSVVVNGLSTSFWFDKWCSLGPLIEMFGEEGPRHMGIPKSAVVADACTSNGWLFSSARSPQAQDLLIALTTIQPPNVNGGTDKIRWRIPGDQSDHTSFSVAKTWECLRPRAPKVTWFKAIWFKHHVPRHAFCFWLANKDRLPVKMRLLAWGLRINPSCLLCGNDIEDRDHVFLHCQFSLQVWRLVMARMGQSFHHMMDWSSLLTWLLSSSPNVRRLLKCMVVQCLIYHLWQERNYRLHRDLSRTPSQLFQAIDRCVRDSLLGRLERRSFETMLSSWFAYY